MSAALASEVFTKRFSGSLYQVKYYHLSNAMKYFAESVARETLPELIRNAK